MRFLKSNKTQVIREVSVAQNQICVNDGLSVTKYQFIYDNYSEKEIFEHDLERFIVDWMENRERSKLELQKKMRDKE